jgi:dienelactone hydrolase
MKSAFVFSAIFSAGMFISCNDAADNKPAAKAPGIKEEKIVYKADTVSMNGFIAYDSSITTKMPVVLVVHEWWGQNDYARNRAKQLAALGYIAMAVDMYGNGATADNPDAAGKLAMPFYVNPQMAKTRFDAALATIKTYAQADSTKMAGIGYCFGGSVVLNMARMGDNLNGVVSFHGNLVGTPADKNLLKSKILVCHGADDQFVPATEVAIFKKQMDSIGAVYTFKSYAGATHAFTNPDATVLGAKFKMPVAYNAAADSASWKEMKAFFVELFK